MEYSKELIPESGAVALSDERWREARRRAKIIEPLARKPVVTLRAAVRAANELGLSKSAIYELVGKWRRSGGSLPSLVPPAPTGGRGKSRLPQAIEEIIQDAIDRHYLSRQKPSISAVMREIRRNCRLEDIKPPAFNTIKARITQLCPESAAKRREGVDSARRLSSAAGSTPNPESVLDIVQIDHTKIDVIIVDAHLSTAE